MGRMFTLTEQNQYLPGIRKKTIARTLFLGPTTLKLLLVIAAALLAVFYIAAATSSGTRYLDLSELIDQKEVLEDRQQQLELEETRLRSLPAIEGVAPELQLEPIKEAQYLNPISGVARASVENHQQ